MRLYHFWNKQAEEVSQSSVPEDSQSASQPTPSTPKSDQQPDPHAEDKHKLDLEAQEQSMQHKQEMHEQKIRHTEELHGLKMQTQGASSGEGNVQQEEAAPPMSPEQAQAASQSNLLANYIQTKMGESLEDEEAAEAAGNPVTLDEVRGFLRKNQAPEDAELHRWAESKGVSPHAAEELIYQLAAQQVTGKPPEDTVEGGPEEPKEASAYTGVRKIAEELVRGGMADGKSDSNYPQKQIDMGVKVEKEHTPNPSIAKEIAKDHLEESPVYYTELAKMEKKLEARKGEGSEKKAAWQALKRDISTHLHKMGAGVPMHKVLTPTGHTMVPKSQIDANRRKSQAAISSAGPQPAGGGPGYQAWLQRARTNFNKGAQEKTGLLASAIGASRHKGGVQGLGMAQGALGRAGQGAKKMLQDLGRGKIPGTTRGGDPRTRWNPGNNF